MNTFDLSILPEPFGLNNPGVICHFNSLIQLLLSCSSFVRKTLESEEYFLKTPTGKMFYDMANDANIFNGSFPEMQDYSAKLLTELRRDLQQRSKADKFGLAQECAYEGLTLLLEMIDLPQSKTLTLIDTIFGHRVQCDLVCGACKNIVSSNSDTNATLSLFYFDAFCKQPDTVEKFSQAIAHHGEKISDYLCDKCNTRSNSVRVYKLNIIPPVLICAFNIYNYPGLVRRQAHWFPDHLIFDGIDGNKLRYKLIAQVEQYGSRSSGHYTAKCLRRDGNVYEFNDTSVTRSSMAPSPETYLIAYEFDHYIIA